MNFLSHHYIQREIENPYFHLGKVLPDLVRISGDRIPHGKPKELWFSKPDIFYLNKGTQLHFNVDEVFHNSEYFKKYTKLGLELLQKAKFTEFTKYQNFLAHIAFELILDKIILEKDKKLCDDFYFQLNQTEELFTRIYLDKVLINGKKEEFFTYFRRFMNAQYLFHYKDNESITFALDRIVQRTGLQSFTIDDKEKLTSVIVELEAELKTEYREILEETSINSNT